MTFTNLTVFIIVSLFYCLQFFIRQYPGFHHSELKQIYDLSEAHLGIINSLFYWTYALMQIPAGLLLDKFGLRKMLATSLALTAVSCLLLSSNSYFLFVISRIMFGFSSSFAFLGMMLAFDRLYPSRLFPILSGIGSCAGMLGSYLSSILLPYIIELNYLPSFFNLFLFTFFILAVITWFITPEYEKENKAEKASILELSNNTVFVLLTIIISLLFVPAVIFPEIWGPQFLNNKGYSLTDSGQILAMLSLGMFVFAPLWGIIYLRFNYIKTLIVGISAQIICLISIINLQSSYNQELLLFFLMGVFSSIDVIIFTAAKDILKKEQLATGIAILNLSENLAITIITSIFARVIGYNYLSLNNALNIIPILSCITLCLAFVILFKNQKR